MSCSERRDRGRMSFVTFNGELLLRKSNNTSLMTNFAVFFSVKNTLSYVVFDTTTNQEIWGDYSLCFLQSYKPLGSVHTDNIQWQDANCQRVFLAWSSGPINQMVLFKTWTSLPQNFD